MTWTCYFPKVNDELLIVHVIKMDTLLFSQNLFLSIDQSILKGKEWYLLLSTFELISQLVSVDSYKPF